MEKNNQFPNLPSNYVTLSQLQQRWLKEKQHRNLKDKKRNRKNKKQEQKEKMAMDGETETHREKAVVREKPEPPATVEKKRVPVKRYAIKRDLRTVEMEGEVKNVTVKSKHTIEIEKSIGDLSLNEESDRSEMQNNTYNCRNMEYRTRSRIVDSSYSKHRVRAVNRSDSEYKGVNGGFNRRSAGFRNGGYRDNGRYRGSDRNWKDGDSRNETVWVKKEVIVGTDNA